MLLLQHLLCENLRGPMLFTCETARDGKIKTGGQRLAGVRWPPAVAKGESARPPGTAGRTHVLRSVFLLVATGHPLALST